MRSLLTRRVFRRIIDNRGYLPRHSRQHGFLSSPRPQKTFNHGQPKIHRRSLFNWFDPAPKEPREMEVTPGLPVLLDLASALKDNTRRPDLETVVEAWREFIVYKLGRKQPLHSDDVGCIGVTCKYILSKADESDGVAQTLSKNDIEQAMATLNLLPTTNLAHHKALAKFLLGELEKRRASNSESDTPLPSSYLYTYVKVTCLHGDVKEGRGIALENWKIKKDGPTRKLFTLCLEGSCATNDLKGLEKTLQVMEKNQVPFDAKAQRAVISSYINRGNFEKVKEWYLRPLADGEEHSDKTNYEVIRFCKKIGQLEWLGPVFQSLIKEQPTKRSWDSIFVWAATIGKSPQEIGRMMDIMIEKNNTGNGIRPNGHTILGLLEYAYSTGDNSLASAYIEIGETRGIRLDEDGHEIDASIFVRLIDLRLSIGDIEGALSAYQGLHSHSLADDSDVGPSNRLIQALSNTPSYDFATIENIVSDLETRKKTILPETLAALCQIHLDKDDFDATLDLLHVHSFKYSSDERNILLKMFLTDFNKPNTSDDRAWEAYVNIRQGFPEMTGDDIIPYMVEFFRRKRSDQGVMVFRGMKDAGDHQQPTTEAYVRCFKGLGLNGSESGFKRIHNYLKLDLNVETTTRLRNAMMQAMMSSDQTRNVFDVWEDIDLSEEGPDTNSIVIVLQACDRYPFPDVTAEQVWSDVTKYGIDITIEMYATYLAARMKTQPYAEQLKLVEEMEENLGLTPNLFLLASIYNADVDFDIKDEIEKWGRQTFPKLWAELEKYELEVDFDLEFERFSKKFKYNLVIDI